MDQAAKAAREAHFLIATLGTRPQHPQPQNQQPQNLWVYYLYAPDTGEPVPAFGAVWLPLGLLLHANALVPNRWTNNSQHLAISPPGEIHESDASKWRTLYAVSPNDVVDLASILQRSQASYRTTNPTRRDSIQRFLRDVQDPEVSPKCPSSYLPFHTMEAGLRAPIY